MIEELVLIENPYGSESKEKRGNPMGTKALANKYLQGVNLMDAGAALGGLAASTMIPGLVVKETNTTTQKLLKIAVSLASTIAAGYLLKQVAPGSGKMAVAGGLAGTLTQVLTMFTPIKIGGQPGVASRQIAAQRSVGAVSRSYQPEFKDTAQFAF